MDRQVLILMVPQDRDTFPPSSRAMARFSDSLRYWLHRVEVDRAVIFVLLARVWQLLAGPVTLLLIAHYFTPELQGFYYTFASLLALQIFVELAFSLVIINVASHEWADLALNSTGHIVGKPEAISRLVSLGRLVFTWYAAVSVIFIIGVGTIGSVFFTYAPHSDIQWQGPWLTMVILTGLLLWMLPFNALLEGCNQVTTLNQFRLSQAIMGSMALWLTIILGGGLWAAAASTGVIVLRDLYLLLVRYRRFFKPFFKSPTGACIHWRTELWPMQWRLALAGSVNYFAFSLFNPVMFQYHGAAVAGRMGMTMGAISGLQSIAMAWVQPKVARFGILIAKKEFGTLDRLFLRISIVSLAVIVAGAVVLWLVIYGLHTLGHPLSQRVLPPLPTGLFLLAAVLMQILQCQAVYLRAHKREPLLVLSVVSSLAIGLLVWLLGSRFGPLGAAASYLAVVAAFMLPYETALLFRCRAAWHAPSGA